jgi:hypothetical protein
VNKITHSALIACTLCSCKSKSFDTHYSSYDVEGAAKLSVVIDGKNIDSTKFNNGIIDNTFYMELMTAKDTFFIKPINSKLSFPKLHNRLSRAIIYYNDFKLEVYNDVLTDRQDCFYFPNGSATLYLYYYPFTTSITKKEANISQNQIYFEIKNTNGSSHLYGVENKHLPNHK